MYQNIVICGTGVYVPPHKVYNEFLLNIFISLELKLNLQWNTLGEGKDTLLMQGNLL